jgi:hypothetical protein
MNGNKLLEGIRKLIRRASLRLQTLPEPREGLIVALLVAATASWLSLGIILRAGSAAPPGPLRDGAFGIVLAVGVLAYNFAFLLACILVAWIAWTSRQRNSMLSLLAATALLLIVAPLPFEMTVLRSIALASVAAYLAFRALPSIPRDADGTERWSAFRRLAVVTLLVGTLAVYLSLAVGDLLAAASLGGAVQASGGAEFLAIVVAAAGPLALRCRWDSRAFLLGAVVSSLFVVAAVRSPLVPLIAMWSSSFSLHLPIPLYAIGLGGVVYALFERVRWEGTRGAVAGLWLLALVGIGLKSTYELLLVLTGLILLYTRPPFLANAREQAQTASRPAALVQESGT